MKHYEKTEGYKWTRGDGAYYTELYAPENAPDYTLVPESEIPIEDEELTADEALDIILNGYQEVDIWNLGL